MALGHVMLANLATTIALFPLNLMKHAYIRPYAVRRCWIIADNDAHVLCAIQYFLMNEVHVFFK